ncbi:mechanosensitive ion channel domain-containing protein [Rhizobium leguminosarum]|uniref:mechanosensitive ion channel domain-containing protein n=1 Tax=Rhizobium leguminosarum TaxID=384 RepID=UPI001C95E701|nr:mechanosensitive ion channel domain-containing protein [Rhizobium leguminosarum]MBY5827497.1 mechanosensitive ion channel [Rhizobium leguminosarum]
MSQNTILPTALMNLLGIAAIVVWHLQGRSRPNERLITQIVFFLAMTATLVPARIVPFQFDAPHLDGTGSLVVMAKILWWAHLSWATIGFLRIYIVLDGRPREARLIQDLLVAIVYLGVLLSVMAFVFGVPIGTILATSGVFAIILGLALQNTLGDVFSGIALTLGRPYTIGDWILLPDGTEGRVVASNWRSTYLLTGAQNLAVMPNSVLAKQGLTNVSKPDETHMLALSVRIVPTHTPAFVLNVMLDALSSCNSIVQEPPSSASLIEIDAGAIDIQLFFRVTTLARRSIARNEVIDLVYRHCIANGLVLAMPVGTKIIHEGQITTPEVSALTSLRSISLFSDLTDEEKRVIANGATEKKVNSGEELLGKGSLADRLLILREGVALRRDEGEIVARLGPGEILGAWGIFAGQPENTQSLTLTPATVYEIDKSVFDKLVVGRPGLIEDLASRLHRHGSHSEPGSPPPNHSIGTRADLVHAIRSMFRGH